MTFNGWEKQSKIPWERHWIPGPSKPLSPVLGLLTGAVAELSYYKAAGWAWQGNTFYTALGDPTERTNVLDLNEAWVWLWAERQWSKRAQAGCRHLTLSAAFLQSLMQWWVATYLNNRGHFHSQNKSTYLFVFKISIIYSVERTQLCQVWTQSVIGFKFMGFYNCIRKHMGRKFKWFSWIF